MPKTPTVTELVEQFRLKERGRDRGRRELPSSDSPRLDAPETEVIAHCEDLFTNRLTDYNRHRADFENRMRTPAGTAGAEADVEQACLDMDEALEGERPELESLARTAQQAIGDFHQFRREMGLARDADYPESRLLGIGILLCVIAVETVVNGLFFGTNVSGGLFVETSYAVLISVFNVCALGFLAAVMFRLTKHRDPLQKLVGWTVLAGVMVAAVGWNLLVGHYREALAIEYPPEPRTAVVESGGTEQGIEACWRGPDEADADREALCLFTHNPVRLGGVQSYLLLAIGLLACLAGAYDWYKLDDAYPGYGHRDRRRKKAERELADERFDLFEKLKHTHDTAQERLTRGFTDPVDYWKLALRAFDGLNGRYRDFRDFTGSLEASVRGALDIYRNNNAETRSTPEPGAWKNRWAADWRLPAPPTKADVITEQEARNRSGRERAALEARQARLRTHLEDCQTRVNRFANLDHYDRAGPQ